MVQEWLTLLGLTTAYMTAAEAMIDSLQGKLGVDTRQPNALAVIAAAREGFADGPKWRDPGPQSALGLAGR
jgi:hypothetical protein